MPLRQRLGRDARARARSDRGQSTVEFALVLPLVFGLLLLVFQVALVGRDELLVTHSARDAAREATVTADPGRIAAAARHSLPGAETRVVRRGRVGGNVEVAITYVSRTNLPLVGALVPDLTLHGRSVMRVEKS